MTVDDDNKMRIFLVENCVRKRAPKKIRSLLSSWANSNVGWVSDGVTHAGVGFRSSISTYSVLRLIGTSYLA